jgi:hypothetical protein
VVPIDPKLQSQNQVDALTLLAALRDQEAAAFAFKSENEASSKARVCHCFTSDGRHGLQLGFLSEAV